MQAEWPRWLVEVGCLTGSPSGLHVCALGCTGCVVPGEGPGQLGRLWICTLKGVELFGGEGIQAGNWLLQVVPVTQPLCTLPIQTQ